MNINKIILGMAALFFASHSFAGNRPEATTLTLGGAYYHFAVKRHLNNASMPNVIIDYNVNENWAVDILAGLLNTDRTRPDAIGVHGYLYTLDGLYRFNPHHYFEPYVLAGIGMTVLKPNANDSEHQGNVNAGLGTQFFVDKSIALRGEVRDIYTMSGGKNDWMLNFGVSFLIDGSIS